MVVSYWLLVVGEIQPESHASEMDRTRRRELAHKAEAGSAHLRSDRTALPTGR
jgi:hypothetical protein